MNRRDFIKKGIKIITAGGCFLFLPGSSVLGRDCISRCGQCRRNHFCCTTYDIPVTPEEREILEQKAKELNVKIKYDDKGQMIAKPCVFFDPEAPKGKNCIIYPKGNEVDIRPKDCRAFYCPDWCPDAIPKRFRRGN